MTGAPQRSSTTRAGRVGNCFIAIDPERFAGAEEFLEFAGRLADGIAATPLAHGYLGNLLPGEQEARSAEDPDTAGCSSITQRSRHSTRLDVN
jgi:LDH2 family malate/lactate/ureidoglycolate dehydrogenase